MSLYEPLLGLLPASESDILSINPRVHPDALLARLRRLERFGAVKRDGFGKYVRVSRGTEEAPLKRRKKAKPAETKVCARCGRERNRLEWFPRGSKYCYPCRPRKLETHAKWKEKRRRLAGIKARYAHQMAILRGECE